ncbi:hypothetical protein PTW35_25765 (plasmid) [Photobacterium sp. DA100]|uniref:hypothetical protein n=1 Tax=Photobacterium sp. DA100 TaxID=3027472 RepID=UPI00247AEDD6|nr:hypothetical protein [Photobacterium sp. DA100]WEM44669.1 hypothetical protein PTW35_25765 [Photobacterium sp. DA100]
MFFQNIKWLGFVFALMAYPAAAQDKVLILDFLMDSVEICDGKLDCTDVDKSSLPDPKEETVIVASYDKKEGMLMFEHLGHEKWVHITEVELNHKAVASIVCTQQTISKKSDKQVFSTHGLGEGC